MSTKTVNVYDFATQRVSQIPAAELAPGMIKANVEGVGEVFIRADGVSESNPNRILPEGFEPIASVVLEIIGPRMASIKSSEDWLGPFRKDAHPVRELISWMWVAAVYHEMTHGGTDPEPVTRDVFTVLVSSMTNGAQALEVIQLGRISTSRAKAIIARHQRANSEHEFVEFWSDRIDFETLARLRAEEEAQG